MPLSAQTTIDDPLQSLPTDAAASDASGAAPKADGSAAQAGGAPAPGSEAEGGEEVGGGFGREAVMRLLVQPQMLLAMGLNLAHGFVSAYLTSYVNGTVIRLAFGRSAIGFFSALTPAVAGLVSLPLGLVSRRLGSKLPAMLLGLCSLAVVVGCSLPLGIALEHADDNGTSPWVGGAARGEAGGGEATADEEGAGGTPALAAVLMLVYVLEGVGRAVFEGPNRALFADWFESQREQAFACWIVQSGGTATVAFVLLGAAVPPAAVGMLGLATALAAIPALLLANRAHKRGASWQRALLGSGAAP